MRRYHETFRLWEYLLFAVVTLAVLFMLNLPADAHTPPPSWFAVLPVMLAVSFMVKPSLLSLLKTHTPPPLTVALLPVMLALSFMVNVL